MQRHSGFGGNHGDIPALAFEERETAQKEAINIGPSAVDGIEAFVFSDYFLPVPLLRRVNALDQMEPNKNPERGQPEALVLYMGEALAEEAHVAHWGFCSRSWRASWLCTSAPHYLPALSIKATLSMEVAAGAEQRGDLRAAGVFYNVAVEPLSEVAAGKSDVGVEKMLGITCMKSNRHEHMSKLSFKPSAADLAAAPRRRVKDLIAPNLKVLFVGINPGIYTAAIRRHFGRPGNRFWPALYAGGFTPRVLSPFENTELLALRYGITNLVERPTVLASELTRVELQRGARRLERKVLKYRPQFVAFLGITSYREAFGRRAAVVGEQADHVLGASRIWVLPNPSGLNAHFTPGKLKGVFAALREAVERHAAR